MVTRIISEIYNSINNECYIAALTLALTLPDICGKAEYPDDGNGARYKKWYKEFLSPQYPAGEAPEESPYPTEKEVYQLRCSMLHQASSEIDEKILRERSSFSAKNGAPVYILKKNKTRHGHLVFRACSSSIDENGSESICVNEYRYEVDIETLCTSICKASQKYYESNKEKFAFINFQLVE